MKDTIKYWKSYFEKKGIIIDVGYIKFILADLRKKDRERRNLGLDNVNNLYKYRKSMVEDMLMSSSEYLNGEFLDVKNFVNSLNGRNICLFPNYELTSTYRFVSSNPCIGNLDNYLKKLIVPRDGFNMVSIDFKHQEPWIIINLIENQELMDILISHDDFYMGLLERFNVEQNDENREKVKKVWNSSIYGSSLNKLFDENSKWISDVYDWINHNDEILKLRKKVEKNLKDNKEIYTQFGLYRHIPYDGDRSVRQAFNSIFQMSGAGVLYTGLKNIHNAVKDESLPDKINIYFTNHDEYILEISEDFPPKEIKRFLNNINFNIAGWTEPKFEIRIGKNWGDLQ